MKFLENQGYRFVLLFVAKMDIFFTFLRFLLKNIEISFILHGKNNEN